MNGIMRCQNNVVFTYRKEIAKNGVKKVNDLRTAT